ncbi:MAG: corrinoid protein-associated methyltransferase CpaM [Candidatus Heimdallarchaeota archaeon]
MSYVYMKSLEHKAEKYDKGIKLLTLGKLIKVEQYLVENYLLKNDILLDIGMGTGTLAILAAKKGAKVIGIDNSKKMLEVASKKISDEGLNQEIEIMHKSVIEMDDTFNTKSFDKIVAILLFSELYEKEQEFCLKQINRILKDNGEFFLIDEVKPKRLWKKVIYFMIRVPLALITFLRTQLTTSALVNFEKKLAQNGFSIVEEKLYLLDTLKLMRLKKEIY